MTNSRKNLLIRISAVVIILLIIVIFFLTRSGDDSYADKYEGYDLTVGESGRSNTYNKYLMAHNQSASPASDIEVDIFSFTQNDGVSVVDDYEGYKVVKAQETSSLEYTVNVKEEGFYNIYLEYFPEASKGINIERKLYIDDEIPFVGCDSITLKRIWADGAAVKTDNRGNQIRPTQIEKPRWENSYFTDNKGYIFEPYKFYFKKGDNVIRLDGVSEPLVLRKLTLKALTELPTYEEYLSNVNTSFYNNEDTAYSDKIQGETSTVRSDPSLYATYDRSSGSTEPSSVTKITLNMIGGQAWRVAGQWVEWDFEVPNDGMYRFTFKARQNYNRGLVSNRAVYIDGEIPFEEVSVVPFKFNNQWQMVTLQDDSGEDLLFPLTKGKHTIRLQVNLGELSSILNDMEECIFRLNEIYLQILVLTGPTPDPDRDYRVNEIYPDIMTRMEFESKTLYKLVDELSAYSGQRGSEAASLQTLAKQLEKFLKKPQDIPKTMTNFKENISAIGNSLIGLANSQLDIDYIAVTSKNGKIPDVNQNGLQSVIHELASFGASFFVDYNTLGNIYDKNTAVQVWMLSGRDQSSILKTMIDDTYTPETGNYVNVKLIGVEALMPAVVAGTGPDVALTLMNSDPVNYALRKAVRDLSGFEGFEDVISEFYPSAMIPMHYNGGYYGLPETQYYNVMFYRKDILEDLGLEPPQTWTDLIDIIPVLQKQNMNVGIPSVERKINNMVNPDLSNFFAQLYQRGGTLYNENGSRALLDTEVAVSAFEHYTKYFTHYKTPTVYDFVNRFRTGEMPIGFADYNNFNTLVVFAPEIKGLWDFTVLPGTVQEDGSINRATSCWGNACIMLANTKNENASWQFMKWWVNSKTQVRFGRELESIMGSAARYATANTAAFEQLSWNAENSAVLKSQWEWVIGVPEVPGGYYASRHIVNAVRKVINKNEDTRETLLDYNRTINEELKKKRDEFGLDY